MTTADLLRWLPRVSRQRNLKQTLLDRRLRYSGLYSITFTPDANAITAENPTVEGIVAGGAASASFEIYNGGLETIDGLAVEISDADGNAIDVSQKRFRNNNTCRRRTQRLHSAFL